MTKYRVLLENTEPFVISAETFQIEGEWLRFANGNVVVAVVPTDKLRVFAQADSVQFAAEGCE